MSSTNRPPDHFSLLAEAYARYRPSYPSALFDFVAAAAPAQGAAWDCACGSGQATQDLATRFDKVLATDLSADQISKAPQFDNVQYSVATAEDSHLPDSSVDAVVVAQALHWFDIQRFHEEVRRVARPGALILECAYGMMYSDSEELNEAVMHLHDDVLGPFWPPEREHVTNGYAQLDFPFRRCDAPPFEIVMEWSLSELKGYLSSWSALGRARAKLGTDPLADLETRFASAWGDEAKRTLRWPLTIRAGFVDK